MMRVIFNPYSDPFFNMAAEETLFDSCVSPLLMLWRNAPAVIIGANQNVYAEIDADFVRENNVRVVRRMTGGGAVYHDLGNINYTYIAPGTSADFSECLEMVTAYLKKLGLDPVLSGRNDIEIGGKKISGTAKLVRRGKTLFHGTLLFDSDINMLSRALQPKPYKLEGKGVKSVKARVGLIGEMLPRRMTAERFMTNLAVFCADACGIAPDVLSDGEYSRICALRKKYADPALTFTAPFPYDFERALKKPSGYVCVKITVGDGKITQVRFEGDFFGNGDVSEMENSLIGVRHEPESVEKTVSAFDVGNYFAGFSATEISELVSP